MKIFLKIIFKWTLGILIFSATIMLIVSFLLAMGLTFEQIDDGLDILGGTILGMFVLTCIYQEWKALREEEKKNGK